MLRLLSKTKSCSIVFSFHHRPCLSSSPAFSTQKLDRETPNFMLDYLIKSFGFSIDKAVKVSKGIAHVKSPEKPDSVRHFLKQQGFTDADIKTIITLRPTILCSSPENTLEPNLGALREMGISAAALTKIVISAPHVLMIRTALPRIRFWSDFLGGDQEALVRAVKNNTALVNQDVASKIAFFESHGVSPQEIHKIMLSTLRFLSYSDNLIEDILKRAKELGFLPGSGMFVAGLRAVLANSRETMHKKNELLKSFGWSEDDFFSALRKCPSIINMSEKNLEEKMKFLIGEVKCEPSYIASNPRILLSSLKKTLRSRHHVLHLLDSKGVSTKRFSFLRVILMTNEKFVETYILPHKETIPGLLEDHLAACA